MITTTVLVVNQCFYGGEMENLKAVIKINKEHAKEDFLRNALIKLSNDKGTPIDILDSEFGEIEESQNEYLSVHADVDINYTCQIGNDRKEEYWDKETYYENGIKKYRDVKKTRTVTDWSPFSGSHKSEEIAIVANLDEDSCNCHITDARARDAVRTSNTANWEALSPEDAVNNGDFSDINHSALRTAEYLCKSKCFNRVSLPGDRHKDEHYSGSVKVKKITGYILPEFYLQYTYKDKTYNAKSFAAGEIDSDCTAPTEYAKVESLAKKKARPFLWSAIGVLLAAIVCNILSGAVSTVFVAFCVIGYLCSIGLFITYFFIKRKFKDKIYENRLQEKLKRLNEVLEKRGLAPFVG